MKDRVFILFISPNLIVFVSKREERKLGKHFFSSRERRNMFPPEDIYIPLLFRMRPDICSWMLPDTRTSSTSPSTLPEPSSASHR